jgi:hypothetical protein
MVSKRCLSMSHTALSLGFLFRSMQEEYLLCLVSIRRSTERAVSSIESENVTIALKAGDSQVERSVLDCFYICFRKHKD